MTAHHRGQIRAEDCLFLFIDIQERLFPVLRMGELLEKNAVRLARFAAIMDIPAILSEQVNLGPTIASVADETTGATRVAKSTFSCFREPDFMTLVEASGKTTLLLAGAETHVCVMQTALDAMHAHRTMVIADAVTTRAEMDHATGLARMAQKDIEIVTTEMLMFELLGDAARPEFKPALALIK